MDKTDVVYINATDYYSNLAICITRVDLKSITLSEISQMEIDKERFHFYVEYKNQPNTK